MREKMQKLKEKCKRLKGENRALSDYVKSFKHPLREADPSFIPPSSFPWEDVDEAETIRRIAQNAKECVDDVFATAGKLIEDLAHLHSMLVTLLNRLEVVEGLWEDVHIYHDLTIPGLRALMKVPKQALLDGKVIQENEIYDFPRWFCDVFSGRNIFEKINMESLTLKDSIRRVQEEIISVIEALFVKKLNEDGVTLNFLKTQLHEFFFVGSFSKEHFENVSSFSSTMNKA